MTNLITLELSDDIVQQIQTEAQKHNITPENFVAHCLTQTLSAAQKGQKPTTINEDSLASYLIIAEMFSFIREAKQFKREQVQLPATPLALHVAKLLLQHNLIDSLEVTNDSPHLSMTLHLAKETLTTPQYGLDYLLNYQTDDPRLETILAKLRDPDSNIRIQGIHALGDYALGDLQSETA